MNVKRNYQMAIRTTQETSLKLDRLVVLMSAVVGRKLRKGETLEFLIDKELERYDKMYAQQQSHFE